MLAFDGSEVRLDRDLVVRFAPPPGAPALRLSAFRNPKGTLPDGLALAPWERPSEIPPETDGFFLLELQPPAAAEAAGAQRPARAPVSLAIVFDTSLSHRWSGLETAYAQLVRALELLTPQDRFALVAFDRRPALVSPAGPATPEHRAQALSALRERALAPGSDVAAAVAEASRAAGEGGRVLLLTDGPRQATSRGARRRARARAAVHLPDGRGVARGLRRRVRSPAAARRARDRGPLFFSRLVGPPEAKPAAGNGAPPFAVKGGDPKLRDVYPVLSAAARRRAASRAGSAATPCRSRRCASSYSRRSCRADAPRSTPRSPRRRSTRATCRGAGRARGSTTCCAGSRLEGERREWVEEVIALSKRYKFVTPYTAFLAAPRSLLRPRRIQPGDPVLRVECDPGHRLRDRAPPVRRAPRPGATAGDEPLGGPLPRSRRLPDGRHAGAHRPARRERRADDRDEALRRRRPRTRSSGRSCRQRPAPASRCASPRGRTRTSSC